MALSYEIEAQVYDLLTYAGTTRLRIETLSEGLPVRDVPDELPVVVTDLATGQTFDIDFVAVFDWRLPSGETVAFAQIYDEDSFQYTDSFELSYLIPADTETLPAPNEGETVLQFLDRERIDERFVDDISGRPFEANGLVAFDLLEGLEATGQAGLTQDEVIEIALLYETGLDRDGDIDLEGLNFWIDETEGGLSREALAGFFLMSDEFAAAFGAPDTLSDSAYVDTLYQNTLGRAADDEGFDFWLAQLTEESLSRERVLLEFAVSVENRETLDFVETVQEVAVGEWAFVA